MPTETKQLAELRTLSDGFSRSARAREIVDAAVERAAGRSCLRPCLRPLPSTLLFDVGDPPAHLPGADHADPDLALGSEAMGEKGSEPADEPGAEDGSDHVADREVGDLVAVEGADRHRDAGGERGRGRGGGARARAGRYSQQEVNRGLPAQRLVRHFERDGTTWVLRDRIRRLVTFQRLNLSAAWPALPAADLVLLRNVLIYFSLATKQSLLRRVRADALRPDGSLFLGASATTLNFDAGYAKDRRRPPGYQGGGDNDI